MVTRAGRGTAGLNPTMLVCAHTRRSFTFNPCAARSAPKPPLRKSSSVAAPVIPSMSLDDPRVCSKIRFRHSHRDTLPTRRHFDHGSRQRRRGCGVPTRSGTRSRFDRFRTTPAGPSARRSRSLVHQSNGPEAVANLISGPGVGSGVEVRGDGGVRAARSVVRLSRNDRSRDTRGGCALSQVSCVRNSCPRQ